MCNVRMHMYACMHVMHIVVFVCLCMYVCILFAVYVRMYIHTFINLCDYMVSGMYRKT